MNRFLAAKTLSIVAAADKADDSQRFTFRALRLSRCP